ncbi:MAG TPA: erythromycin esterase family protein [Planctomycetota bacterium]|nr:erythromycin esterase family protein [Planctomycetota bacterium]
MRKELRTLAQPVSGPRDIDRLMTRIGDARYVLLGEASHGTSEYYTWRAAISQRLIRDKGFSFVAVEGDWPDCMGIDRFIKGRTTAGLSARDVLHAFERWPTWMWANEEVSDFVEWLEQHNQGRQSAEQVGFYGLDVYSLWDSLYAIMNYLRRVDPLTLTAARRAFRCFEPYGEDVQEYARAARFVPNSCEDEVVTLLSQMRSRLDAGSADQDEAAFQARQNAEVLKNAESYYRAMVRGGPGSWNIRDRHMSETLERLMQKHGPKAKAIVWEHNTHVGDARFTDMASDGMVNVGQLVREAHAAQDVVLVGFGSYQGSVIAGSEWGATPEVMLVPPARPGSWESLLHEGAAKGPQLLTFERASPEMLEPRGHRAIGVVYQPEFEAYGNYVPTVLPRRYDSFVFLDRTQALRPLHVTARTEDEVPETYPSGM